MKTGITILRAKHISKYKIQIFFSDGYVNIFDYESLVMRGHGECLPYIKISEFKKFKICDYNIGIEWGENGDLALPLHTIYEKQKVSWSGRKPVSDKKQLLRLYVNESIINANGGVEECQQKCTEFLKSIKKK